MNDCTKQPVTLSINQINAVSESLAVVARERKRLAQLLPECPVVSDFYGVGATYSALSSWRRSARQVAVPLLLPPH
jgi:hypothetical protein